MFVCCAPIMRRFLIAFAVLALFAPASAEAACGVSSARAEFETPEVQVYPRGSRLLACLRATGRERVVGVEDEDERGNIADTSVRSALGGRWLWTTTGTFSEDELEDLYDDRLIDLRSGDTVRVRTAGEGAAEAVGLAGVLVEVGGRGVLARYADGRVQRLSTAPATSAAAVGARVYWREAGAPRTAVLVLPAADPARPSPLARTVHKCKPRPGARLIERYFRLVVSRSNGVTWACNGTKARRVSASPDVDVLGATHVGYPGGILQVGNGKRLELPSAQTASDGDLLVGAGPDGLRAWPDVSLAAEPASEPAIAHDQDGTVAFWLDGAGAPRVTVIPR
jgi:hypothetical protein